jgi:hypothetical protein
MQTEFERRLRSRRQTHRVAKLDRPGWQPHRCPQGNAQPSLYGGPEPVEARAGEGDPPWQTGAIQCREGSLSKETGRLIHRERDRLAARPYRLGRGRADPDQRQRRQSFSVAPPVIAERQNQIQLMTFLR